MGSEERALMLDLESRLDEDNDSSEPARQVQSLLHYSIEMGRNYYGTGSEKEQGGEMGVLRHRRLFGEGEEGFGRLDRKSFDIWC